jgi:hypothetical protein
MGTDKNHVVEESFPVKVKYPRCKPRRLELFYITGTAFARKKVPRNVWRFKKLDSGKGINLLLICQESLHILFPPSMGNKTTYIIVFIKRRLS